MVDVSVKDYCMLIDTLGASTCISKESSIIRIILAQLQWFIQITTAKKKLGRVNRNHSSEAQVKYILSHGLAHVHNWLLIICMQLL